MNIDGMMNMLNTLKNTISSLYKFYKKKMKFKFHLQIPTVIGDEDEQAVGKLIFYIPPEVTHVRFANSKGALQFMPWEEVYPNVYVIHKQWTFMGVANAAKEVFAEARLKLPMGKIITIIVMAHENPRKKGLRRFPIDHIGWPHASQYLLRHEFKDHVHQWASYHDKCKNVWYPMYFHPDKYAWNSHFERGPDKGETPVTCLAMHNYFRWFYPTLKFIDLHGITFQCELAFEGDLKGATAHFFILITEKSKDSVGGIPSSGRYHQKNPAKVIKLPTNGEFANTTFTIDSDGWVPYYQRNRSNIDYHIQPDLKYVEGFGIAFHHFEKDNLPEGILKCRLWEFKFNG